MTERQKGSENVLVLGSGNFGTCLAFHLASQNETVRVWARDATVVESINKNRRNPKYLRDIELPENLKGVGPELTEDIFRNATVVLFSIPTQHLRGVLKKIKHMINENHLLILANKGIEMSTLQLSYKVRFFLLLH